MWRWSGRGGGVQAVSVLAGGQHALGVWMFHGCDLMSSHEPHGCLSTLVGGRVSPILGLGVWWGVLHFKDSV